MHDLISFSCTLGVPTLQLACGGAGTLTEAASQEGRGGGGQGQVQADSLPPCLTAIPTTAGETLPAPGLRAHLVTPGTRGFGFFPSALHSKYSSATESPCDLRQVSSLSVASVSRSAERGHLIVRLTSYTVMQGEVSGGENV